MAYRIRLLAEAEHDLDDIYDYVAREHSPAWADQLLNRLEEVCASLGELPERGHIPPELLRVHVSTFREVHCMPYRVVYQVAGRVVFVHAILDGRRDMQSLLERRLLRAD
jgi:toxin ParE1/3/4